MQGGRQVHNIYSPPHTPTASLEGAADDRRRERTRSRLLLESNRLLCLSALNNATASMWPIPDTEYFYRSQPDVVAKGKMILKKMSLLFSPLKLENCVPINQLHIGDISWLNCCETRVCGHEKYVVLLTLQFRRSSFFMTTLIFRYVNYH